VSLEQGVVLLGCPELALEEALLQVLQVLVKINISI